MPDLAEPTAPVDLLTSFLFTLPQSHGSQRCNSACSPRKSEFRQPLCIPQWASFGIRSHAIRGRAGNVACNTLRSVVAAVGYVTLDAEVFLCSTLTGSSRTHS